MPQWQQHHDDSHDLADSDGQIGGYFFHHHTHTHLETMPHDARLSTLLQSDLYRYEIHELAAEKKRHKDTANAYRDAQPTMAACIAAQRTDAAAQLADCKQLARIYRKDAAATAADSQAIDSLRLTVTILEAQAVRDRDDYTAAEADRDTAEKQLAEYKQLADAAAAGQVLVCKLELQLEAAQLAATANARGARQAAADAQTADSRLIQRNTAAIASLRQRIDTVDCRLADTGKEFWEHTHSNS